MSLTIVGLPTTPISSALGITKESLSSFASMAKASLGLDRLSFNKEYPKKKFTNKIIKGMAATRAVLNMSEKFKEKNSEFVQKIERIFPQKFQNKIGESVSTSYLSEKATEMFEMLENDKQQSRNIRKDFDR